MIHKWVDQFATGKAGVKGGIDVQNYTHPRRAEKT